MSNFHTCGCLCNVLDHCLQSGTGEIPKWEPQAWMGIYGGHSPSHAYNVGFILNTRIGHVSPQLNMVPHLRTAAVPPHWAELVEASSHLEVYSERQVGTWQTLPELDVDPGDLTSNTSETLNPTINQDCEGENHSEAVSNVESPHDTTRVNKQLTFSDHIDYEIHNKSPVKCNS
jgi:hypothetical protein